MKDLFNRIKTSQLFPPKAAVTDNTAQASNIIDLGGYYSAIIELILGTESDADAIFDVKITESDDSGMAGATAVATTDLQPDTQLTNPATGGTSGAQYSFLFSNDNINLKIGYLGIKRYLQVTVTPTNNTGNLFMAGSVILSNARHQPAGVTQTP